MQFALRGYKRWISPMFPHACRFVPTCSEYALEAITRHGTLRGTWLAFARLMRCQPFGRAGYDPVPLEKRNALRCSESVRSAPIGGAPETMSRPY